MYFTTGLKFIFIGLLLFGETLTAGAFGDGTFSRTRTAAEGGAGAEAAEAGAEAAEAALGGAGLVGAGLGGAADPALGAGHAKGGVRAGLGGKGGGCAAGLSGFLLHSVVAEVALLGEYGGASKLS